MYVSLNISTIKVLPIVNIKNRIKTLNSLLWNGNTIIREN